VVGVAEGTMEGRESENGTGQVREVINYQKKKSCNH